MDNTTLIACFIAPSMRWIGGKVVRWMDRRAAGAILVSMPNGRLKSLLLFSTDNRWGENAGGAGESSKATERLGRDAGK